MAVSSSPVYGLPLVEQAVPLAPSTLQLISQGIATLWNRIVAAQPDAEQRPLLLSYDVHPSPAGPVLIEVNTNAGGVLTAIRAARLGNTCCADWEQGLLEQRLLALFRRDLLGATPEATGVVAIVDDQLASQPLRDEMQALGELLRPSARDVVLADAAQLEFSGGRLRYRGRAIDRIYWRSTDFMLQEPAHAPVREALAAGAIVLAPSPQAYRAIADKRRFLEWSAAPELARDNGSGLSFNVAETLPLSARSIAEWYAARADWVFKPVTGHASRGVYLGKSISRQKLSELPADAYLAQRYAPHPVIDRDGRSWKYDVRFFADRGQVIGAAARVFQGQVVGMRALGSGFAPIKVDQACCLVGALGQAAVWPRAASAQTAARALA